MSHKCGSGWHGVEIHFKSLTLQPLLTFLQCLFSVSQCSFSEFELCSSGGHRCSSGGHRCSSGGQRCSSGGQRCSSGRNRCSSSGQRCSRPVKGTVRVYRPPPEPHLCPPLLLSNRRSQQAALQNRLHRGPQIVLTTKKQTWTLLEWKHNLFRWKNT